MGDFGVLRGGYQEATQCDSRTVERVRKLPDRMMLLEKVTNQLEANIQKLAERIKPLILIYDQKAPVCENKAPEPPQARVISDLDRIIARVDLVNEALNYISENIEV